MTHLVYQAFGEGKEAVDLYDDVLQVPKESSLAQLRKAYYKQVIVACACNRFGADQRSRFNN
jgi:hypothetical protein